MAIIATLSSLAEMDTVSDYAIEDIVANVFPTPPRVAAFLGDEQFPMAFDLNGISSPFVVTGAVYPESDYLEPTVGQIWPR